MTSSEQGGEKLKPGDTVTVIHAALLQGKIVDHCIPATILVVGPLKITVAYPGGAKEDVEPRRVHKTPTRA